MKTGRLEAFSDGVLAIIITIMVLELKAPPKPTLAALQPLVAVLLSYVLSFVFIGVYWSNHHHLLYAARRVSGRVLWANLHLLFWLSLVPFTTRWMGDTNFESWPVATYGFVLLLAAVAYWILTQVLIAADADDSALAVAIGRDRKGIVSLVIYAAAVAIAFFAPLLSCALYVVVAIMWLIPERRIETVLEEQNS